MMFTNIMGGHFDIFNDALKGMLPNLIACAVATHQMVADAFVPSAIKFHYNFNMRDLAAVFQGLCASRAQYTRTSLPLARLWMHECARVYADRLVSSTEKACSPGCRSGSVQPKVPHLSKVVTLFFCGVAAIPFDGVGSGGCTK